jgi:hypothetical protein
MRKLERGWVMHRNLFSRLLGHTFVTVMLAKSVDARWPDISPGIWEQVCCYCVVGCYSSTTLIRLHSTRLTASISVFVTQLQGQVTSSSGRKNRVHIGHCCCRKLECLQRQQTVSSKPTPILPVIHLQHHGVQRATSSQTYPTSFETRFATRLYWLSAFFTLKVPRCLQTIGLHLKQPIPGVLHLTTRNLPRIPNWPYSRWPESGVARYVATPCL